MSMSNYLEEQILRALRGGGNGTSFTAPTAVYLKLHTGDPGEDGTANAATETTRQACACGAPSNPGGTMTNSADVRWTNVAARETYSYVSAWDASTAGNPLLIGQLTAPRDVAAGDTFVLAAGDVTFTMS